MWTRKGDRLRTGSEFLVSGDLAISSLALNRPCGMDLSGHGVCRVLCEPRPSGSPKLWHGCSAWVLRATESHCVFVPTVSWLSPSDLLPWMVLHAVDTPGSRALPVARTWAVHPLVALCLIPLWLVAAWLDLSTHFWGFLCATELGTTGGGNCCFASVEMNM